MLERSSIVKTTRGLRWLDLCFSRELGDNADMTKPHRLSPAGTANRHLPYPRATVSAVALSFLQLPLPRQDEQGRRQAWSWSLLSSCFYCGFKRLIGRHELRSSFPEASYPGDLVPTEHFLRIKTALLKHRAHPSEPASNALRLNSERHRCCVRLCTLRPGCPDRFQEPEGHCSFLADHREESLWEHTAKPVPLFRYLARTYSERGSTVLDFSCGSGTTAVAVTEEGSKAICIEKTERFFGVATKRLRDRLNQPQELFA